MSERGGTRVVDIGNHRALDAFTEAIDRVGAAVADPLECGAGGGDVEGGIVFEIELAVKGYIEPDRVGSNANDDPIEPSLPGPNNYTNISDRYFQVWVKPNGGSQGTTQSVVMDSNQHGVRKDVSR